MRIPFFSAMMPKKMTEAELEAAIARRDWLLDRQPKITKFIAYTTIPAIAVGQITKAVMAGSLAAASGVGGLVIGGAYLVGASVAAGYALRIALHQRNKMTDAFNAKVTARIAAEQDAERQRAADHLLGLKAAENFNAAIEAGLPLEASIKVRPALKLKRPEPPQRHGFARVKDFLNPRL